MKASEYIEKLKQLIEEYGDKDIYELGSYRYQEPIGPFYRKLANKSPEYSFLHEPDDYIRL